MKRGLATFDLSEVPIFILAGGLGTRLSEETESKPKPMVEIGGIPILVHIMRSYYAYGFRNFVICAGYRAFSIKQYFLNYPYQCNDMEFDALSGDEGVFRILGRNASEQWRVRVLDTGLHTMTGARVARTFDRISHEPFEFFGLTYGDGLTDANLKEEFEFHRRHGKIGTLLGVRNIARYGEIETGEGTDVRGFFEKAESRQGYVNGGFFFFQRKFRDYLSTEEGLILEKNPLSQLALDGELQVFRHPGFWQCMDTLRDKQALETLWTSGQKPWVRREKSSQSTQSATELQETA